jgi:hypothetical protein
MSHYIADRSPYAYRLPPDTFLSRRDPGWYIGAAPAPGHKLPPEVLQKTVAALVQTNAAAKQIADQFVRISHPTAKSLEEAQKFEAVSRKLFGPTPTLEWAERFTQGVEDMVVRLISVNRSGFYAWEVTPKLVTDLADYVEKEGKFMIASANDLTTFTGQVAGALRQAGAAILAASAEALDAAADKALELAEKMRDKALKDPINFALVAGGVVGVLALYFYIKR